VYVSNISYPSSSLYSNGRVKEVEKRGKQAEEEEKRKRRTKGKQESSTQQTN
jgi:hypothetical protein